MVSIKHAFVGGIAVAAIAASPAQAALKVNGEYNDDFVFPQGAVALVPLKDSGATSLSFSGSGKFIITYTAECSVDANTSNTWVTVDIYVDGVGIGQSVSTVDAFCTSNGTEGFDGWTMAAIQVVTPSLGTGTHTAQVKADVINGVDGDRGSLGDSSITVVK